MAGSKEAYRGQAGHAIKPTKISGGAGIKEKEALWAEKCRKVAIGLPKAVKRF